MAGTKKTADELREESLTKRLNQIHESAQYLTDDVVPTLKNHYPLDAKALYQSGLDDFELKSPLFSSKVPNVGLVAKLNEYKTAHTMAGHLEEFKGSLRTILTEQKAVRTVLKDNINKQFNLLLNKQGNVWEPVDSARWKSAFDDPIKPLIAKIDAELKVINEKKFDAKLGYEDKAAGHAAFEAARTAQAQLLKDYKANLEKELDHLKNNFLLDSVAKKKFQRINPITNDPYGENITLHEHYRQQLNNETQREIANKKLKTANEWVGSDGNVISLTNNPTQPLPAGEYRRGDRWQGLWSNFSYNSLMDTKYKTDESSVHWRPVFYSISRASTIEQEIDGALRLYAKQTGSKKGFIKAGKGINPDYLLKLAERAATEKFQLELSNETVTDLQNRCPDKLTEIQNALHNNVLPGIQLQVN